MIGSGDVLLSVVPDCAVREGVANAEQSKALGHLLIIEKGLIGLVHFPGQQLASAGAAGARPTGIGKIDALLFCRIEDVGIIGAGKRFAALEGDRVASHWADSKTIHPEVIPLLLAVPRTT